MIFFQNDGIIYMIQLVSTGSDTKSNHFRYKLMHNSENMIFYQNDKNLDIIQRVSTKSNENQWNIIYFPKKVLKNNKNLCCSIYNWMNFYKI